MIIDNIGWNVEAVRAMTKQVFINDPQHIDLYWRLPDKDRKKALVAAYDLISGGKQNPAGKEDIEEQE